jgi:hypothetical protein
LGAKAITGMVNKHKRVKQQQANEAFLFRIEQEFVAWAAKKGYSENLENFTRFLVCHSFIPIVLVNRYLCISEYHNQLDLTKTEQKPNGIKERAFWNTENLVPLGETQIKHNVRNHSVYFRERFDFFP